MTTGTTTATARAGSGTRGKKVQTPNATTGTTARTSSTVDDGWVTTATIAIANAKTGTSRRSSSEPSLAGPVGHPSTVVRVSRPLHPLTERPEDSDPGWTCEAMLIWSLRLGP